MKVYIDGKFYDRENAKISVYDHGLLYGDGVFEGIRFYNGRVFRLKEHLERLARSAQCLALPLPMSLEEIAAATLETCRQSGLTDGYIRLLLTRGVGSLGLNPFKCERPSLIIIVDTIELYPEEYYHKGVPLITAGTRKVNSSALNPNIKSLNYLSNIMAKIEAIAAGTVEAVMLNEQGYVAEGTGDNIFIVKGNRVATPPITAGILPGITREVIMELCQKLDIPCIEENMTRYELYTADEIFLTGTGAEILPVVKLDGRIIGKGRFGPVTLKLIHEFRKLTQTEGTLFLTTEPAVRRR
jgi:branched-chain amino acid aminotransferase